MIGWIDVKTTGTDERRDMLLQVAFTLTRDDGNSMMGDRAIRAYPIFDADTFTEAYNLADESVKDSHAGIGLWDLLTSGSGGGAGIHGYRSYPEMDMGLHDLIRKRSTTKTAMVGLAPADCLVVEDAAAGLEAARAGGMDCAIVGTAPMPFEPTYHMQDVTKLPGTIL